MKKFFGLLLILLVTSKICIAAPNTNAMLQYNKGIDYYKNGQYDNSIGAFREAIKLDPNYIDAYYNLGSVLEYMQQYDAALVVFKQIIVRKPDDYDSVYKAAWLSHQLGEDQKAKTFLALIPVYSPRSKDAQTLASQLKIEPSAEIISEKTNIIESKMPQNKTNGIYENIPAPTGMALDSEGNLFIAEFNMNTILKITPDNKKMVYLKSPKINGPIGLAIDKSKNMYIANYNKNNILKVSPLGEISILISNIKKPYYLLIEDNMLYVSCQGSNSVLRYKLPP